MASTVMCATFWNLTVQPLSIYRATVGPVKFEIICRINSVLRNLLPIHGLLLSDAIMLVKYAFLFHMKNPTAVQDDFWNLFLNVWIFFFTTASQIFHILAPGPDALNFYICVGRNPEINESSVPKKNYFVLLVLLVSFVIYMVIGTKYFYSKFILNKIDLGVESRSPRFRLNNESFVTFTTNILIMFLLSTCFLVLFKVNKMNISNLNSHYIWFYALQLYLPSAIELVVVAYFFQNKILRNHVKVDFLDVLQMFCYKDRVYPVIT